MATSAQLAQYCLDHGFIKPIHKGSHMSYTPFIALTLSHIAAFVAGWYVKGRGWFGVKVDATNAVQKVESVAQEAKSEAVKLAG